MNVYCSICLELVGIVKDVGFLWGVLNVVIGYGYEVGVFLVLYLGVDKVC